MQRRHLEIRLKKPTTPDGVEEPVLTEEKLDHIFDLAVDLTTLAGKYFLGYMVLDTIRKTIVAKASRPVVYVSPVF